MKKILSLCMCSMLCAQFAIAQQNVGIGTTTPNPNAMLEVSANDKGVLLPRLTTTQRTAMNGSLAAGDEGLIVYDSTLDLHHFWDGAQWVAFGAGAASGLWTSVSGGIHNTSLDNVAIGSNLTFADYKLYVLENSAVTTNYKGAGYFFNQTPVNSNGKKYGLLATADQNGSGEKIGVQGVSIINVTAANNATGVYGSVFSTDASVTVQSRGVSGLSDQSGSGSQYGVYGKTGRNGTGQRFGVWGEVDLDVSGTAPHSHGTFGKVSGGVSGYRYGLVGEARGGSSQALPIYGSLSTGIASANQTGDTYGAYNSAYGGGTSTKFGAYNLAFTASGQTNGSYGSANFANGITGQFNSVFGVSAVAGTNGEGNHYALYATAGSGAKDWSVYAAAGDAYFNDDVRIGHVDDATGYKLSVNGKVICEEVRVRLKADWPDYVFAPEYNLPSLKSVKNHIKNHQHLPGIPSAATVEKEGGIDVGDMNTRLLEKVEELTLYLIQQSELIEKLEARINKLED